MKGDTRMCPAAACTPAKGEPGKTYKPPTNNTGWVDFYSHTAGGFRDG